MERRVAHMSEALAEEDLEAARAWHEALGLLLEVGERRASCSVAELLPKW
jgi:hypothetical protein